MGGVWTIAAREVSALFRLPVGWIVVALYALLSAVVFVQYTLVPGAPATMRYFFTAAAWMMIPVAPAISMRLLSEEARAGTIEMLRTAPVSDFAVALGKMLGAWTFLCITLAPTLVLPFTLALVSEPAPDPGPIVLGYLVLGAFGGLCLGIGLVASALTSSQTLAFLGTLMALALLMMVSRSALPSFLGPELIELLSAFSATERIAELSRGVLDTAAVSYFLIGAGWAVVVAAGILETRRLSRYRGATLALWCVFLAATGATAVLAGVLTHTVRFRADVTSTGAHRLSPRAERMVDLIEAPTELVFAIDTARADRLAADLVTDVLRAYDRASGLVTLRVIDLSSPRGLAQTDALLGVLAQREEARADRVSEALRSSVQAARLAADEMELLSGELSAVQDAITATDQAGATNRAFFEQRAALARVAARTLLEQAEGAEPALTEPDGPAGLVASDRALPPMVAGWKTQREQLTDLHAQVRAYADSDLGSANARALARTAADRAERLRDLAAVTQERLERLPGLDTLRVARALETGEALLVIGPPTQGVAAVDLDALLPSTEVLERAGVSPAGFIGPRAQELVATAIGRLVRPERPILVFTHAGGAGDLLGSADFFTKVVQRLRDRGIDSIEWAATEQPEPPGLLTLDPAGQRPVVYAVISPDSTRGSADGRLTGAQQAKELAAVVQGLLDSGKPVLLSLNPSIFPTYGDTDPMGELAASYGITPRTGMTLLRERVVPGGRRADELTIALPAGGEHPIADALGGLRTLLPWAIPIDLTQAPGARAWPLIELTDTGASEPWAESRWLRLWSTPAQSRALLREQPTYEAPGDTRSPRWILAAAGQRTTDVGESRLVVVGSNSWATDGVVLGVERMVDGRVTTRFPGNAVLLDAAISWLAGQDELIAPGAEARPVAVVKPLSPARLSTIRWVLVGLIPALVLVTGAGVRALTG